MMPKIVEELQCSGCINSPDNNCYVKNWGIECRNHCAGTVMGGIGSIFLGMPKGFNRVGHSTHKSFEIYENLKDYGSTDGLAFSKWQIPVWKYKDKSGIIFVRGLCPRINSSFLVVFLSGDYDSINCLEITEEMMKTMD